MRAIWIIVAVLMSAGCSHRQLLKFSGTIELHEGAAIPKGYYLVLREGRRQDAMFSMYINAVDTITPQPDGAFTFSGHVCPDVFLVVPYGGGLHRDRDDPVWSRPLRFALDEAQTAALLNSREQDQAADSSIRDEIEWLQQAAKKHDGIKNVPC